MRSVPVRLRKMFTLLLIAITLSAGPVAAAQPQQFDPGFYTSVLTGVEIEATGPDFAISGAELQHYTNGQGEVVTIDSETVASSLEVSFFDDSDSPQETLDIYLASYESMATTFDVVDRGINGEYHYALAVFTFMDEELVYYLQVFEDLDGNIDLFEAILTTPASLQNDLATAQAEVTVDGYPFMENVDPVQLGEVVADGGSTLPSEGEATPAEPADSVEFTQFDANVSIGPDFAFLGEPEVTQGIEAVQVQGPRSQSIVAVGQTGQLPVDVMDSFEEGITSVYPDTELVYEEIDSEQGWRILSVPKDDGENTYLIIVVNTSIMPGHEVMHAHEMPADGVAGSLITIQDQVSFNGQPLMPEIDPEEMAFYVDRHAGDDESGTETVATEEGTTGAGEETTSNPREDARLPELDNDIDGEQDESRGNTSETSGTDTGTTTDDATPESSGDTGTLTDSSWEGGVHGHLIEWDPGIWSVDPAYPEDLISDHENQEDTIVLQGSGDSGDAWLFISVFGASDITPLVYLDFWTSEEFLVDNNAEVLDTRTRSGNAAVVIRYLNTDDEAFFLVRQAVELEDGTLMIITFDAPEADALQMYELASEVTIDGDAALRIFAPGQIERTIGD